VNFVSLHTNKILWHASFENVKFYSGHRVSKYVHNTNKDLCGTWFRLLIELSDGMQANHVTRQRSLLLHFYGCWSWKLLNNPLNVSRSDGDSSGDQPSESSEPHGQNELFLCEYAFFSLL